MNSCSASHSLERQLKRTHFNWETDTDGDYRVTVPLPDRPGEAIVGVSAHSAELGDDVLIREIWSVAARIPGELPDELAENLMADSWSTRSYGSWAIAGVTSDGRTVIVYLVRIPADVSARMLKETLLDAAVSASSLSEALASLEGDS